MTLWACGRRRRRGGVCRGRSGGREWGRRYQLRQLAEVLGGGCEEELVAGAHGPRNRRRSRRRMRLRWANSISTFLRCRRDVRRPRSWRCHGPCHGRPRGLTRHLAGRFLRAAARLQCAASQSICSRDRAASLRRSRACPWRSASCRPGRRRRRPVVGEVLAREGAVGPEAGVSRARRNCTTKSHHQ